jgi:hypothetical protein
MRSGKAFVRGWRGVCALAAAAAGAAPAAASGDSCREWREEHAQWEVQVVRLYLHGAAQRELDEAVFEMLQREAYLTSCDSSLQVARGEMVGWRLAGRTPEEYGSAVLESLLERAGFDVGLRSLFDAPPRVASGAPPGRGRAH